MDALILSLAIKLYKKILSFFKDYQSDIFGTAKSGNAIVTSNSDSVPGGWKQYAPNANGYWEIPVSVVPQFENLTVDENLKVTTQSDTPYLFLYVRDTLTLKKGAQITMSNRGNNSYSFSEFLPKPSVGQSAQPYTTACLKLFISGRSIKTPLDLICCGGKVNQIALSAGGTVGSGGGLIAIYHKLGEFSNYLQESVHANGGTAADALGKNNGGGMLFIFAKKIVMEDGAQITSDGGDGNGLVSYIDSVPRSVNALSATNPNNQWGGAGVVAHIPMDVL